MKIFCFFICALLLAACGGSTPEEQSSEISIQIETETEAETEVLTTMETEVRIDALLEETEEIPEIHYEILSFEENYEGFFPRGDVVIERSSEFSFDGEYSLLVTERTAAWNGAALDVTELSEEWREYEFGMMVMPAGQESVNFQLSVEIVQDNGPMWRHLGGSLARVTAQPGEWTLMTGTFVFPEFNEVSVYIETDNSGATADFFIDAVWFRDVSTIFLLEDLPSLKEVFEDYFVFGVAAVPSDLRGTRLDFITKHFNALTAGNEMKPDALQPRPGEFNFSIADSMLQTALDANMYMIGHTLVWHSQSPAWMNPPGISRDEAIRNLEEHITTVASHYAGKILAWDVVNEAFPDGLSGDTSDWRARLRETPWLEAIGPEYIEIAFRAAHAADPNALLIYNDFNLDSPAKREAVFHMLQEFLEMGVPVHGVGMQAHYSLDTNPENVRDSILRFSELGIPVSVTELDVGVPGSNNQETLTWSQELRQSLLYARLFRIFMEHSELIHRVTFWGLDDGTSWRSENFPLVFNCCTASLNSMLCSGIN